MKLKYCIVDIQIVDNNVMVLFYCHSDKIGFYWGDKNDKNTLYWEPKVLTDCYLTADRLECYVMPVAF